MIIVPKTVVHQGITVVRDDLFPGGTKARYIADLFEGHDEVVYASPAQGGAQSALAAVARELGKRATIFVAKRAVPHPRALLAKQWGAKIYQVKPGHLNVVQARARRYAEDTGSFLAPFGFNVPTAPERIAAAARSLKISPHRVWCAGGSGTLATGLSLAWPDAEIHVVQVGRPLNLEGFEVHECPIGFDKTATCDDFPSDPHYDAKAWLFCLAQESNIGAHQAKPGVLFWNVTGPAEVSLNEE